MERAKGFEPRHPPWQGGALPTELRPHKFLCKYNLIYASGMQEEKLKQGLMSHLYFFLTHTDLNLFLNLLPQISPMNSAHVAQSVERVLGKDEVGGSNPLVGSTSY